VNEEEEEEEEEERRRKTTKTNQHRLSPTATTTSLPTFVWSAERLS
jgi:hypothetical protein